jgi:hypothetical protein
MGIAFSSKISYTIFWFEFMGLHGEKTGAYGLRRYHREVYLWMSKKQQVKNR